MRISDWSSDVCSSDLRAADDVAQRAVRRLPHLLQAEFLDPLLVRRDGRALDADAVLLDGIRGVDRDLVVRLVALLHAQRSEEHTSELQSLMRRSYAVFCLKKKTTQ